MSGAPDHEAASARKSPACAHCLVYRWAVVAVLCVLIVLWIAERL